MKNRENNSIQKDILPQIEKPGQKEDLSSAEPERKGQGSTRQAVLQEIEKDRSAQAGENKSEEASLQADRLAQGADKEDPQADLGKSEEVSSQADQDKSVETSPQAKIQYSLAELKKRRKKNQISFIASLVIIGCVLFALIQLSKTLQQGDEGTFNELIAGMNWRYLLIAAALFIVMFLADSLKYTVLTRSYGFKMGFHKDMKVALIGKYYEAITPFSTGGQPMQIYYFYKSGMTGAKSTSITMVKYAVQMLAVTVAAAIVMGIGVGQLDMVDNSITRNTIMICGWIGFGINAFIPVFVTFIVFCPRAMTWIINLFVKLLYKIKIIKNAEKLESRIRQWMDDFAVFSQFIYKKPLTFFVLFLLCLTEPVIQFIIPYFVLIAMCGTEVMGMQGGELLFAVMALAMYATYAAAFIPTPGNSGAVESVFMLAFTAVASSVLFWYVLVWRFILYYSYIVFGIGMNVFDVLTGLRREGKKTKTQSQERRE